jgi:hypothetical protein
MHTLRCAVVVVQDCRQPVEEGMIELADADIDAEDGGEDEVKEKVEHCCYVAFMRQVVSEGSSSGIQLLRAVICISYVKLNVGQLHPKPEAAPVLHAACCVSVYCTRMGTRRCNA